MSVEISDIRAGLAANIATVITAGQVSAYRLANPTPPAVLVTGVESIDQTSFGSSSAGYEIVMAVQALAGRATDKGSQMLLDQWLSPWGALSVEQAISADRTLGGKVSDVTVLTNDGTQIVDLEGSSGLVSVLASTWHVQIDL